MYTRILVPTDGSPLSLKAAKTATNLAKPLNARITAVYVIPPFAPPSSSEGMLLYAEYLSPREYRKLTEKHAQTALARVNAVAEAAGVSCTSLFLTGGTPWESIIKVARSKKCGLIVMVSHGRRGLAALLLGSETTTVLTHSRIPVLVCR